LKRYQLGVCLFLCACASGGSVTTFETFYDVPIGASKEEVVEQLGEPIKIQKCEDGTVEYEYVERIKAGSRNVETRHYYIQLKEGKVVSKRVKQTSPPAFQYNSYQMQTTQNDGETPSK